MYHYKIVLIFSLKTKRGERSIKEDEAQAHQHHHQQQRQQQQQQHHMPSHNENIHYTAQQQSWYPPKVRQCCKSIYWRIEESIFQM